MDDERERLLEAIAREGSRRCGYAPGGLDPKAWPTSRCDCKYVTRPRPFGRKFGGEETGCCEMRAAYAVLAADVS
jgi:hypothetical protein